VTDRLIRITAAAGPAWGEHQPGAKPVRSAGRAALTH
jgi:hypothetical protein